MTEPFDIEAAEEFELTDQLFPMRHIFMRKYHIADFSLAGKRNFAAYQVGGCLAALKEFDAAY